eukprot:c16251_g1_i1 orf=69-293(+)
MESSKGTVQGNGMQGQVALTQEVQKLEVACAELKALPPSRSVYHKRGAVFFRSDVKTLTNLQQNLLEKAKAGLT